LLKNQSDVVTIASPEPIFQPQTLVTGFHRAASRTLDKFRILEQVSEGNPVVPPYPVHINKAQESGSLRSSVKDRPSGNRYGDLLAIRLVQYGPNRSFEAALGHFSHLLINFDGAEPVNVE